MSLTKVRSALTQSFVDGAFFDNEEVQWENLAFRKPTDKPWAAFWFVPSQPEVFTCGENGDDEVDGFVQIDLNFPLNNGTKAAEAMYEDIKNVFTAGQKLVFDTQGVVIRSCGRSQGRIVNGCFQIIVTITFYAHINR